MDDLNTILDGTVAEVNGRIDGRSHDDLLALREAEKAGDNRKGVLAELDEAIEASSNKQAGGRVEGEQRAAAREAPRASVAADLDQSGPADIAPATEFEASGAPRQVVPDVDPTHPAVDNDPRAGTTVNSNRIDFNDPTITGAEAVERSLGNQASA